jgi:hypothetical protein
MCTVSFIPNTKGFYLGMNRDESRLRSIALQPEAHATTYGVSIYPSEPSGGTWIGINDSGLCLALINWHKVPTRPVHEVVSRGIVVKELIQSLASGDLSSLIRDLPIEAMPPFRLIAISLRESLIREFRWDQNRLTTVGQRWVASHWFSSGLDEHQAEVTRAAVCRQKWNESDAGELAWLRRLHASHLPDRGGFSICMHREDSCTVSYTEVVFQGGWGTMGYHPGSLCNGDGCQIFEKTLSLTRKNHAL